MTGDWTVVVDLKLCCDKPYILLVHEIIYIKYYNICICVILRDELLYIIIFILMLSICLMTASSFQIKKAGSHLFVFYVCSATSPFFSSEYF